MSVKSLSWRLQWKGFLSSLRWYELLALAFFVFVPAVYAVYDTIYSAPTDVRINRQIALNSELSNFLLSVVEPEGTSVLENPNELGLKIRPLSLVTIKKPFYTYLLNRSNANYLTAEKITWETPRPCIVRFESHEKNANAASLEACLAIVPSDKVGRYVYFTLRYPTSPVVRHKSGENLTNVDRVILSFDSARVVNLVLVFEPPVLAAARYPSQMDRFKGIHEVAAFLASSPERALRQVNGQAFESTDPSNGKTFMTVVGRIDAALLEPSSSFLQASWPTSTMRGLKIGVEVYTRTSSGQLVKAIDVAPGQQGSSAVSVQDAYETNVASEAKLEVFKNEGGINQQIWSSSDLKTRRVSGDPEWMQRTKEDISSFFSGFASTGPVTVSRVARLGSVGNDISVSLTSPPTHFLEIIPRTTKWVFLGTMAWLFLVAVTRHATKRQQEESAAEQLKIRLTQTGLELRQDRLDAISHEIRSPLQTLLTKTEHNEEINEPLRRMKDAIETISDADSIEDGISSLDVVCERTDIALFLSDYVNDRAEGFQGLVYKGPSADVFCDLDDIRFRAVIDHLLDNARRFLRDGGAVSIQLAPEKQTITVSVYNQGPQIPDNKLSTLFKVRPRSEKSGSNRGIGLFASKRYLFLMGATIQAKNEVDGVAVVITLPKL